MYLKLDEDKWYNHTYEWSDRSKGLGRIDVYSGQIEVAEDVAPVVHAHWILDGKDPYDERANLFACSMCGLGRSFHTNPPAYNYCPWCGAKMDEEQ